MRRDGAAKMRAIAEEASRDGARVQGRVLAASTATASCRGEWVAWQFGPRLDARVRARSRRCSIPAGLMNPGKIVAAAEDGRRARCSASRPAYRIDAAFAAALDWSAWDVRTTR